MGIISYTEDPKRLRETVKLFKMIIANPSVDFEDVVKEAGFTRPTAYERVYDFCTLYENTVQDDNFPENLLKFYNRFSQNEDETLTRDEVFTAGKVIVKRHSPKYKNNKSDEQQAVCNRLC
jgi:hypothetical protein